MVNYENETNSWKIWNPKNWKNNYRKPGKTPLGQSIIDTPEVINKQIDGIKGYSY